MDYPAVKILALFTSLGLWLTLTTMLAVLLLWCGKARLGRFLLSVTALMLVLIVFSPLQPWLTGALEDRFAADPPLPASIDGIIVLGGMIRPAVSRARRRPSVNDAAERLLEGARLARLHPEAKLLFTGGSADPWDSGAIEAVYAAQLLHELGVTDDRLLIEDKARNTHENALFARAMAAPMPGQTWVLVTSAAHMPRAIGAFRSVAWPVTAWPVNYVSGGNASWAAEDVATLRFYVLSRTLHEYVGLLYYWLRGWSDALFPAPAALSTSR
jgi:uncharacterized SAM-binding protein YcdF (DUF218 family)